MREQGCYNWKNRKRVEESFNNNMFRSESRYTKNTIGLDCELLLDSSGKISETEKDKLLFEEKVNNCKHCLPLHRGRKPIKSGSKTLARL